MQDLTKDLLQINNIDAFHNFLVNNDIVSKDKQFMHIEMDISNKCNLRCRMCYFSFDRYFYDAPVYLSLPLFSQIAETLFSYTHTLTLSLGNEPLTSPHFIPILSIVPRYRIPQLTFSTNGLLLNDEVIEAILHCGVTKICFSVDGATKETYETIRRGADFDRLLSNIRRLVARRDAAGYSMPRLRFDVVMMRRNIRELEDIATLASELGVSEMNFFHMVVYEGLGTEPESLVHDKALSNYWLNRALERAQCLGLTMVSHPKPFGLEPFNPSPESPRVQAVFQNTPYCLFPFFHVSINAGGFVLACPFSHGESPFGCLSPDVPFEKVWFGTPFMTLRKRIFEHDPPLMCRKCSFLASQNPDISEMFSARKP